MSPAPGAPWQGCFRQDPFSAAVPSCSSFQAPAGPSLTLVPPSTDSSCWPRCTHTFQRLLSALFISGIGFGVTVIIIL